MEHYRSLQHLSSVMTKQLSAHDAENQLGELTTTNDDLQLEEASKMTFELQQMVACEVLTPSTSPQNSLTA
ncbi:hypothetical protein CIPAW_05G206800 [Carya illinoinensis]|uniref:Uncharacterized protein n=1 Tax=Carya illinoinensis TaxID=32201 RepID=A0A8T1QLH9_CARIL|nr:hypothetical protein CIPAW_05G206800 [Carya illinoinensis]